MLLYCMKVTEAVGVGGFAYKAQTVTPEEAEVRESLWFQISLLFEVSVDDFFQYLNPGGNTTLTTLSPK